MTNPPPPYHTSGNDFRPRVSWSSGVRRWFHRWPAWLRWIFWMGLWGGLALMFVGIGFVMYYHSLARQFNIADIGKMPERSIVYDVRGEVIGRLFGENRAIVKLENVAPHFIDALLAREDSRFYDHRGIDWMGVARAVVRNVRDKDATQGASTIPMQLARNSFGMMEKTLHRKILEAMLAKRIEGSFTKNQILEFYVNRIFFGSGIYGIERAAQVYFGKPALKLTLGESAMLAGIIRGPNKFSPLRHLEQATQQRDTVLNRMVDQGFLEKAKAEEAKRGKTVIAPKKTAVSQESYALDAVRADLNNLDEMLGENIDLVQDGGLRIFTTLDSKIQREAEKSLETGLYGIEKEPGYRHTTRGWWEKKASEAEKTSGETPYLQGAILVLDNDTGGILAMVGGRDHRRSVYNRAMQATRSIGSTIKPFVYAAAFEHGMRPGTLIPDAAIEGKLSDGSTWSPANSDNQFLGPMPVEQGLIRSRNAVTVRVGEFAGLDYVMELLQKAGLGQPRERSAQIYIGNHAASLRNLTSAFTLFPNRGQARRPFIIDRIETADGHVVFRSGVIKYAVLSPSTADSIALMLSKALSPGGTGSAVRKLGFKSPAGGKTGTTNDYRDAWFLAYTERLTCGVWVGFDKPTPIITQGYGGRLALPIWVNLMTAAEKIGYVKNVPRAVPVFEAVDPKTVIETKPAPAPRAAAVERSAPVPGNSPRAVPIKEPHPAAREPAMAATVPPPRERPIVIERPDAPLLPEIQSLPDLPRARAIPEEEAEPIRPPRAIPLDEEEDPPFRDRSSRDTPPPDPPPPPYFRRIAPAQ